LLFMIYRIFEKHFVFFNFN